MCASTTADHLLDRLERLTSIGVALSAEQNIDMLLEHILVAAKQITHADGGTLYTVSDDQRLQFAIVRNTTLGIALGGTTGQAVTFEPLRLYEENGAANEHNVAAYAALRGETVNIADAYTEAGFDFSGTRAFDAKTGYRSQAFLTVPMKNHRGEVIGVLQLINALDAGGRVITFSREDQRFTEALASQAAIALTNRQLVHQLEQLFESFITLINNAIDEKSPYTGGHCKRVPVLTMLLAEAAHRTQEGPLKDFRMSDADRYELKIAGLLHDCGKVTTPVHVVDKGTKLQTIFDRIHLIDTRFEVLKRDVEIAALKGLISETAAAQRLQCIETDRAFLRQANIGGEFMTPEDQERVREIGRQRWINSEGETVPFLNDDEIANLTIAKGTLTAAEREIINHHIVSTINMLEALPWPKHLKHVPEYAGGHHERMDGKGYPKGLTRDQMSVQARILGIADIFEALTAADRPYKPGMKLSQAMDILEKMKLEQHIDSDLFDVFVREKVFMEYARAFLDATQIDTLGA